MMRSVLCLALMLSLVAATSCKKRKPAGSQLQNQIPNNSLKNAEFLQLWASRNIAVCLVNAEAASRYIEAIKSAVVSEFSRIGFNLKEGWGPCPTEEDTSPMETRKALVRINFQVDAPAPFGGSTGVGAVYGRLADVTLRADPMSFSVEYCHKSPET